MAQVTFLGACGTVTGSSTLLQWGERRILVDCGLFQGGEAADQRNRAPFAYRPAEIDALVLTHAHLDHTGLVPRLVAEGLKAPIYCTKSSRALIGLVLEDSAKLQEEEARYARKKGYSRHADPRPLYEAADARRAIELLQTQRFDDEREIFPGIRLRFRRAGHLLGAASVEVAAKGGDGDTRSWCFSGDVGRYGVPILRDPEPPLAPPAALLLESTYGDRLHAQSNPQDDLRAILERVLARNGVLIIPAFALGRTQDVLYHLSALAEQGVVDPQRVYLDSPMAVSATDLYERAATEHDEDYEALLRRGMNPLAIDRFRRARTREESIALNRTDGPLVIVAASGMAEGGRVVHHLLHRLGDPRNAVVFVGYQASGTRGRALVDGADSVGLLGERVDVRAEIRLISSLSAHADRDELLRWCAALPAKPERIFLNHGEDPARKALGAALVEAGLPRPALPMPGDTVPW
jgi:metallo-beta-lactamase family protein